MALGKDLRDLIARGAVGDVHLDLEASLDRLLGAGRDKRGHGWDDEREEEHGDRDDGDDTEDERHRGRLDGAAAAPGMRGQDGAMAARNSGARRGHLARAGSW